VIDGEAEGIRMTAVLAAAKCLAAPVIVIIDGLDKVRRSVELTALAATRVVSSISNKTM